MTAIELVRLVATRRGIDPDSKSAPAALARELGYTTYNAPGKVKRWLKGENEPDYSGTMDLLALAGMLKEPGEATEQGEDELAGRRHLTPLEEVAEQLLLQSNLLEKLTLVAERLDAQTAALEERPAAQRPA